jgi:hypothetical protein
VSDDGHVRRRGDLLARWVQNRGDQAIAGSDFRLEAAPNTQTKWGDDVGPLSHIMFEEQRDHDYNARVPGHPASDEH